MKRVFAVAAGLYGLLLCMLAFSWYASSEWPPVPMQPQAGTSLVPATISQADKVRQIADTNLSLREYWRTSFEYITGDRIDPGLQAAAGYVIYDDAGGKFHTQLQIREAQSGALVWKIQLVSGAVPVAADNERVYFANRTTLYAYALDDGELLWEQFLPNGKASCLYIDGERLQVFGVAESRWAYLEFDIHTGEPMGYTFDEYLDGWLIAPPYPSFVLLRLPDGQIRAVEKDTQHVFWTTDWGESGPMSRPLIFDDLLLVADGWQVHGLDLLTGQTKWQTENSFNASNIVFANESVYALDLHTRLVRLDMRTGQETGYVQFTPDNITEPSGWYADDLHLIAVDGAMVFVAFGDTHELIALGP